MFFIGHESRCCIAMRQMQGFSARAASRFHGVCLFHGLEQVDVHRLRREYTEHAQSLHVCAVRLLVFYLGHIWVRGCNKHQESRRFCLFPFDFCPITLCFHRFPCLIVSIRPQSTSGICTATCWSCRPRPPRPLFPSVHLRGVCCTAAA